MAVLEGIASKITPCGCLAHKARQWRSEGRRIVFTNGCFDILHRGHIEYLAQAADMGDILAVGLNSDASVRRLKGNARPLQDQSSRSLTLAALGFVDCVAVFEEDTPIVLIETLLPDVLVKGADYAPEQIAGYDIVRARGGRVAVIPLTQGYSTTCIAQKMGAP